MYMVYKNYLLILIGDVSPDDFERELDEMLANVKMTPNIIPGKYNVLILPLSCLIVFRNCQNFSSICKNI